MRLLIVGPKEGEIAVASRIAAGRGAVVRHVGGDAQALDELRAGRGADLLLVDVRGDVGGLIAALAREHIHLPVVAYGIATDARAAVAAIRAGAREFLPLPPDSELIAAILEAVTADTRGELVFRDPGMTEILAVARRLAPSEASVLITGESGTGKEMLARYVHGHSKRAGRPLVSVNCAAIPENLLESELFGHEKGAFTGALARRVGKFEEADGGTLLLDEVSEMDPRLQAKLLRAIQEREIDRVGGAKPVKVDIRLIATSNRDLERAVADGTFREDLFFRLNVVALHLPPLRERPGDLEPLTRAFIAKYARLNGLPERPLGREALERLRRHPWRGNVRELENCLHRAVLMAGGDEIGPDAILLQGQPGAGPAAGGVAARAEAGGGTGGGGTGALVGRRVAEVERDLILDTLRHTLGNRTHAATILGISIRTLRNKLREYGAEGVPIPPPAGGGDAERSAV
ncbi:MAG TPA: sigma-54 dependent transcriptional regulator [Geminicoccaceae bacterium]|nr:sigma-54 dependent transcriptional regulator [Geminicoccaceae bacterium]